MPSGDFPQEGYTGAMFTNQPPPAVHGQQTIIPAPVCVLSASQLAVPNDSNQNQPLLPCHIQQNSIQQNQLQDAQVQQQQKSNQVLERSAAIHNKQQE